MNQPLYSIAADTCFKNAGLRPSSNQHVCEELHQVPHLPKAVDKRDCARHDVPQTRPSDVVFCQNKDRTRARGSTQKATYRLDGHSRCSILIRRGPVRQPVVPATLHTRSTSTTQARAVSLNEDCNTEFASRHSRRGDGELGWLKTQGRPPTRPSTTCRPAP